ncbi:hypothetical protein MNEG_15579, partial [Monoraphidium neglectum]
MPLFLRILLSIFFFGSAIRADGTGGSAAGANLGPCTLGAADNGTWRLQQRACSLTGAPLQPAAHKQIDLARLAVVGATPAAADASAAGTTVWSVDASGGSPRSLVLFSDT